MALLAAAEAKEAEQKKQRELQAKEQEKKQKEAAAKQAEAKRAARLRVVTHSLFKTVCAYKPDPKTDAKDRVQGIFVLSTLYEPVGEEYAQKLAAPPAATAKPTAPTPSKPGAKSTSLTATPSSTSSSASSASPSSSAAGGGGGAKDHKSGGAKAADAAKRSADCTVCRSDWDSDTQPVVFSNCGHALICKPCFTKYISIKVSVHSCSALGLQLCECE
jgi:hypothetical protein